MKGTLRLKTLVMLIVVSMILSIAGAVHAYSVNGSLTSSSKLVAGGEVKVVFSMSDIDMDDGVRSITIGNINYDTDVFEAISNSSFVGSSGWSISYDAASGKATLVNLSPVTASGTVFTLTLKVKDSATATSAVVKLENIVAASSTTTTGNIPVGTKTVTINAETPATSGSETPASAAAATETPAKSAKTDSNSKTKTIKSSKTTAKKLPKAGDAASIAVVSAVVALAVVGVVGFVRFYNINKDLK